MVKEKLETLAKIRYAKGNSLFTSTAYGLPATDLISLLTYHVLFCPVSLRGGSHLGRCRALLSHVKASSKENGEQHISGKSAFILILQLHSHEANEYLDTFTYHEVHFYFSGRTFLCNFRNSGTYWVFRKFMGNATKLKVRS